MSDPAALPYETASWPRRMLALLVDWIASILVVVVFVGWDSYSEPGSTAQIWVLLVFVVENAVFTATVGGSFGKMATRLRVIRVADGGHVDLLRSFARSVLIALVIPPLVFRPDGRGLHDVLAGSATVTLQVAARAG
ncbi:RDD family protein [Nocardioides sp. SR21]|uniref:RDD family protein n=1 Tax=Nocardioides sp. SR21 TaxID=2919501 RepID=UPI001FAA036E|nr:RDD family protein [Nocardioides sp. SR21]